MMRVTTKKMNKEWDDKITHVEINSIRMLVNQSLTLSNSLNQVTWMNTLSMKVMPSIFQRSKTNAKNIATCFHEKVKTLQDTKS